MMRRRHFLRVVGGAGAAFGLGGCASTLPLTVRSEEGSIRLTLSEHPGLTSEGGSLRLRTEVDGRTIYLLALDDEGFAALSPICTHQGCTVEIEGRYLVCPCHGSTYDREGIVLRGPAELPLRRYPTRVTADRVLVIETEGS